MGFGLKKTKPENRTATYTHLDPDMGLTMYYHKSPVASIKGEIVTLRKCGWETAMTKLRMNQFSGDNGLRYQVYQEKNKWFIWFPGSDIKIPFHEDNISFNYRNMEVVE